MRQKKRWKKIRTAAKYFVLTLKIKRFDVKQREFLVSEFVTDHLCYHSQKKCASNSHSTYKRENDDEKKKKKFFKLIFTLLKTDTIISYFFFR